MKLLTKPLKAKLEANYKASQEAVRDGRDPPDHKPVVRFFYPGGGASSWLFTELDEDNLFGLCDMGFGEPELGYVSLASIYSHSSERHGLNLGIERDLHFKADKTLSEYAKIARKYGEILI